MTRRSLTTYSRGNPLFRTRALKSIAQSASTKASIATTNWCIALESSRCGLIYRGDLQRNRFRELFRPCGGARFVQRHLDIFLAVRFVFDDDAVGVIDGGGGATKDTGSRRSGHVS